MARTGKLIASGLIVAVAGLAGCGGSSTKSVSVPNGSGGTAQVKIPSIGSGDSPKFCSALQAASQKLQSSSLAQLASPGAASSVSTELAPEISAFKGLADSAPSSIKGNVNDLVAAFESIQSLASSETSDAGNTAALASDAQQEEATLAKLPTDEEALGTYIAQHCS